MKLSSLHSCYRAPLQISF